MLHKQKINNENKKDLAKITTLEGIYEKCQKIYDNFNDLKAPLWKDLIDILDGWVSREQSKTKKKCKENNMHCKWEQMKIAKRKKCKEWNANGSEKTLPIVMWICTHT